MRPGRAGAVIGALLAPSFVALGAPSIALPAIARDLGVPFGASAWVLAAWALCSAVATPVFGRLSRRVGLRRSMVVGVGLVAFGSIIAALAPTAMVLIVGRAIGGAGAGATLITGYATVSARFEGADRARALAVVAAVGTTASGCGTLLGGLLTAWPGWRLVLAVPATALVLLVPAARLAPTDRTPGARIDPTGAALLTLFGGTVVALLQAPSTRPAAAVTIALAVVAVAAAGLLVRHVRREPDGFVPLKVVTAPYFLVAGLVGLTVFAAYYGTLFAAPALIRAATGWTAPLVGAVLLPCATFSILGARAATALSHRAPLTAVVTVLGATGAAGMLLTALLPRVPVASVLGLGLTAAAFAAAQATLLGLVPVLVQGPQTDTALGLFNLLIYGGSSVGPAVVGGLTGGVPLSAALALAAAIPLLGLVCAVLARRSAPSLAT